MLSDFNISILPLQGEVVFFINSTRIRHFGNRLYLHFTYAYLCFYSLVRLCQDKAELIEKALDSSPMSYKDPGKVS